MSAYPHASASQISTFELCPRKWGFQKIDKIGGGPNEYAAFGSRVHSHLEAWFRDGTPPPGNTPEGMTAFQILQHLPVPQTEGIEVEQGLDLMLAGVKMKGYVDFRILNRAPRPFVSDHKTTGRLPNPWAVTEEKMHEDVQVALYGYDAMKRTNATEVDAQWTYGTRDGKKSLPVIRNDRSEHGPITLEQISPRIERCAATVAAMRDIFDEYHDAEGDNVSLQLPYNAAGCEAYGGCDYQPICNLSPRERMRSIMTQKTQESNFLAKLRAKKANGAAAPHPPPAEPAPDTAKPPPVPTSKGTVNPPSAPDTAAAAPDEKAPKAQKKKRGSKRRSKKTDTPTPPPTSPETPPVETKAPTPPPAAKAAPTPPTPQPGGMVPMSEVKTMVELLVGKYREGFRDGFAAAKESSK